MSAIFFRELEMPEPKYNLNIGSDTHGRQTRCMLMVIKAPSEYPPLYWDGKAAAYCLKALLES